MNLRDILAQAGGVDSMARELGISRAEAESGAEALLPAILGGFKKQAQSPSVGLEGLDGLLGQLGGGGLLDNVLSPEPTDTRRGNDVLGSIFGSKDVSRTVANDAAQRTGLDPGLLKQMLPMLAMIVAGFMARRGGMAGQGPAGGLGDLVGGMLGGKAPGTASPRAGGLGGLLDMDGNGNPLDDILRMAGRFIR